MKRGAMPHLMTPPEHAAHAELCRRIPKATPEPVREWWPMESAPRDRVIRALVHGREVRVQWGRTPHLPLRGWCIEGTQTAVQPDAWREVET